jgi:hypothetical protein
LRAPRWLLGLGGLFLIAQVSCSSSDGKNASPEQQCEALSEDICDKIVNCYAELTGEKADSAFREDCVDSLINDQDTPCSDAVKVGDTYGQCVDNIHAASCEDVLVVDDNGDLLVDEDGVPGINELPSSCENVILTK